MPALVQDASVWALEVDVWEKSELSGGDVLGLCLSDAEAGAVSATPGRALETRAALVGPLSAVLATGEGAEVVAQLSSLLGVPGSDKAADAGRLSTVTSAVVGGWTLVLSGTEVVDGDVVFTPEALVTLKLAGIPRSSDIKVLVVLMPAESLAPVNVEFFSVVSVVLPSVTGGVVTAVTVPLSLVLEREAGRCLSSERGAGVWAGGTGCTRALVPPGSHPWLLAPGEAGMDTALLISFLLLGCLLAPAKESLMFLILDSERVPGGLPGETGTSGHSPSAEGGDVGTW